MIQTLFHEWIYLPIYNALALLVGVVPGADVGFAIILLTVFIKLILLPLGLSAARTQIVMREIDPELKSLRKQLKDKPEELARKTLAIFKENKVNPLASIFLLLIQLPVVFGLYFVFFNEGNAGGLDPNLLYSFISEPANASFSFLGLVDLTGSSIVLALLVAISQYVASALMMPKVPEVPGEEPSFQADLAKSMRIQMRYVFPIVMGVIAYVISAAVALYLIVSNLFMIGQELYVRKSVNRKEATLKS